jgi:hypothetical protein
MLRSFVLGLLLLVASVASAAPTITVEWTNPTTTVSGGPLTGVDAITKFQLWIANSPILDTDLSAAPTVELNAVSPLQTNYVHAATSGQTVYVRMKVCNSTGCSNPTGQAQAQIPYPPAVPGTPQNVVIKVTL